MTFDGTLRPIPALSEEQIARFWSHVDMSGDCWTWMGRLNRPNGYGRISINGTDYCAHRISWEMAHGPLPPGQRALHDCDNRQCVRPDHLFTGTIAANNQDKARKGRSRNGWQSGARKPGAAKPPIRLTDTQLIAIVELYLAGMNQPAIARRFGCAQTTVSRVVTLRAKRVEQALAAALTGADMTYEEAA